jgi:hypothetical protein
LHVVAKIHFEIKYFLHTSWMYNVVNNHFHFLKTEEKNECENLNDFYCKST